MPPRINITLFSTLSSVTMFLNLPYLFGGLLDQFRVNNTRVSYIFSHIVPQKKPFWWWIGNYYYKKIPPSVNNLPLSLKTEQTCFAYPLRFDSLVQSAHWYLGDMNYWNLVYFQKHFVKLAKIRVEVFGLYRILCLLVCCAIKLFLWHTTALVFLRPKYHGLVWNASIW